MRNKHIMTMSASAFLAATHAAFYESDDAEEQSKWAEGLFQNAQALELSMNRMTNSTVNNIDVDLIARAITTRCYEVREDYEEDRTPQWFLDMFRERGLFSNLAPGTRGYIDSVRDYAAGPVRFIGDKTDDWPTTGGRTVENRLREVKYFAKAMEYGILELWQSAKEGKDIVGERIKDVYVDIDEFIEALIAQGAPLHGIYGFINHPDIPVSALPPTAQGTGTATEWPAKTSGEIIFDLQTMRRATRVDSNYNEVADTLLVSAQRYEFADAKEIGSNGDFVLGRWQELQKNKSIAGLKDLIPFVPYDTAGPGNTPIATAGRFNSTTIEMPFMPPRKLPTEYHGSKWKTGFVGGVGSVHIKRKNRFRTFTGL